MDDASLDEAGDPVGRAGWRVMRATRIRTFVCGVAIALAALAVVAIFADQRAHVRSGGDVRAVAEIPASAGAAPGAFRDNAGGLVLDADHPSGLWRVPVSPASDGDVRRLVIAGTYAELPRPSSAIVVAVAGRFVARLSGGIAFDDVALPLAESGLRGLTYDIPAGLCERGACDIRISVRDAAYGIQRIGIVTVRPVTARADVAPPAGVIAIAVVLSLALVAGGVFGSSLVERLRAEVRVSYPRSALAGLTIAVAWCAFLVIVQCAQSGVVRNERFEFAERLGSEVQADARFATYGKGNEVLLESPSDAVPVHAAWRPAAYEFVHVLPVARRCSTSLFFVASELRGLDAGSLMTIALGGRDIATVRFSAAGVPLGVSAHPIAKSPLYRPGGYTIPVPGGGCRAPSFAIDVVLRGVRFDVASAGIEARFVPRSPDGAGSVLLSGIGLVELFLTAAALAFVLRSVRVRHGRFAVACAAAIVILATVTHDQWDFPIWLRFVDLLGYGRGMPSYMWAGTPLWAFLPGLSWPLAALASATVSDGSGEVVALFLKLAMGIAVVANALLVARFVRRPLATFAFFGMLLAPVTLYELAGGYREIFAASFALGGLAALRRSRYVASAFAFAFALSIAESVAPFVLAAPLVAFARHRNPRQAVLLLAIPVVTLALEWLALLPHGAVAGTLGARLVSYRFGGASWFGALADLGTLPAAIAAHVPLAMLGASLFLGIPPLLVMARVLRARGPGAEERIAFALLALTVALYAAYAGIDPNDWYPLLALVAATFGRYRPANPFPIVLGVAQGLAYYAIAGLGDFVDVFYIPPRDDGLFGTLGKTVDVAVLTVDGLLLALYVTALTGRTDVLFSRSSLGYAALFVAGFAAATSRNLALDGIVVVAAVVAFLIAIEPFFDRVESRGARGSRFGRTRLLGIAGIGFAAPCTAAFAPGSVAVAAVALVAGTQRGIGTCDLVLVLGAMLELACQPSFGWLSIFGYFSLAVIACIVLAGLRRAGV